MARIRTIKPEFWTDGTMIGLPFEARLFFIGTWNFTLCDQGHLPDDPIGLKLKILPADPVDAVGIVEGLVAAGRLARIRTPDGRSFLHIPRFTDHQKVDARWNSRCPVCTLLASTNLAEPHTNSREFERTQPNSPQLGLGGEGKGREWKGGEGNSVAQIATPRPFCSNHPNGTDQPCRACGDARRALDAWELSEKNKPTPTPSRDQYCPIHPDYPVSARFPCYACAEDEVARAAAS